MNHPDLASRHNQDVARDRPQGILDAIVVIGSLTTAAMAMTKFRNAIAGLLGGVPEWIVPALSGALALLFIVWFVIVPRLRAARRDQRLKRIVAGMHRVPPGAFRLTPFTDGEDDQRAFNRADGEHVRILNWIKRSDETLLYLMGRSGVGKSSLLNAYVLPHLWNDYRIVHLRGVRAPLGRLRDALLKPENVWQDPSGKEALSTLDLLRSAAEHVTRRGGRKGLLLVFDQFEELLILHERESKAVADVIELLQSCLEDPTAGLQILLVMRSDYDGRLRDLGLPTLRQGENYEIVPRLDEPTATQYLDAVIEDKEIATLLVREAAEVEETRGRVRFITLNFLGCVYKDSPRLVHSGRGTAGLLKEQIARWMKEPSIREVAPQVVRALISDQDTKRPRTLAEIGGDTGLSTVRVDHCLRTLENNGVVRLTGEFWEISHDFLARLGAAVARQLTKSIARRLRPFIGPAFVAAWLITVLGASWLWLAREREYEHRSWVDAGGRIEMIEGSSPRRYRVTFQHPGAVAPATLRYLARQSERELVAELILRECDTLTSLQEIPDLPQLTELNLSNCDALDSLEGMPELPQLITLDLKSCDGLTSLEGMPEKLPQLTTLNLADCYDLDSLEGMPDDLPQLTSLDLSARERLDPTRRRRVPPKLASLEGMPGELPQLTTLDLSGCGLTSLEGMPDDLPQLTELNLRGCSRLRSLQGMPETQVTALLLSNCSALTSLDGMPELRKLAELDLRGSGLRSLQGMPELPQLTTLNLQDLDRLISLKGMPELPKLTALNLTSCEVLTSLSRMSKLPNLVTLDLSGCSRLTSLSRMPKLPNLVTLDLSRCEALTSLNGMPAELPQLSTLDLSNCSRLTSLAGMPLVPNLTTLNLSQTARYSRIPTISLLTSLDGLPDELPKLTTLNLMHCTALTSLEGMPRELPELTTLKLGQCGLASLEGMPHALPQLTTLYLPDCDDLNSLEGLPDALPQLTTLHLRSSDDFTSLEEMPQLPELSELYLLDCSGLTSLKGMPKLAELTEMYLSGCTALRSLDGMPELPKLNTLTLRRCYALASLRGMPQLPELSKIELNGCQELTDFANLYDTNRYPALETVVLDADMQHLWDSTRRPGVMIEGPPRGY